jgi:hypothetical protein
MLAQCPQLTARLQVFIESFNLVIGPADSPCLATRASEIRSRVLRVSFSWLRTTRHSSIVSTSKGSELESRNVAMQIGRIFRGGRTGLPSCRGATGELREGTGRAVEDHDDLGHRSDGYRE